MNIETIKTLALEEISKKTFGTTTQFLEIHSIKTNNGQPIISRVDTEDEDGKVIVYFPFEDEPFYLAVCFDTAEKIELVDVYIEPGLQVYLWVYNSPKIAIGDLPIEPSKIGDKHYIISVDNGEPDDLEDKLNKLLTALENSKVKMKLLADKTHMSLNVVYHGYKDQMWGMHLDKKTINRLNNLGIDFDIDIYASGNSLTS
jgi:hypothetical protein